MNYKELHNALQLTYTDDDMIDIMEAGGCDIGSIWNFDSVKEAFENIQQYIWFSDTLEQAVKEGYELPAPTTQEEIERMEKEQEEEARRRRTHYINGKAYDTDDFKPLPRTSPKALNERIKKRYMGDCYVKTGKMSEKELNELIASDERVRVRRV